MDSDKLELPKFEEYHDQSKDRQDDSDEDSQEDEPGYGENLDDIFGSGEEDEAEG